MGLESKVVYIEILDKLMTLSSSCENLSSISEVFCLVDNGMESGRLELADVFTIALLPDRLKTCFLLKPIEGTTQVDA